MRQKTFLIIFLFLSLISQAFGQIKGNGISKTQTRSLALFTELEVNFPAHVTVNCKSLAQLEIITDENIFAGLSIKNEGGKLSILQESWIQPTKEVKIVIGTPFLHKLKTGGYGHFYINNLEGPVFYLDNPVAAVQLAGKVEKLEVQMHKGKLDALQLGAEKAYVKIEGYGEANIHVSEYYEIQVGKKAARKTLTESVSLSIKKEAGEDWLTNAPRVREKNAKVNYIAFKLYNNSNAKVALFVQGPKSKPFSYGLSIGPRLKRKENFPVGTQIYLDKMLGKTLLHTVGVDDENQNVPLF